MILRSIHVVCIVFIVSISFIKLNIVLVLSGLFMAIAVSITTFLILKSIYHENTNQTHS